MRVPVEWLRDFVDLDGVPVDTLVERLPGVGLGIEAVEGSGDDAVLDLEVTSNRPDCLSILGVAREVALMLDRSLRSPDEAAGGSQPLRRLTRGVEHSASAGARLATAQRVAVRIDDQEGCPRFTASVIEGVWVGASPPWMRRRLEAAGVRAINNVVDVTNYVMLEIGQPMHAFDYTRVAGHALTVRRARPGETLETLDGVTRTLDETMLVVADEERAVSLAGIIGGQSTEIGTDTTTVLLEAAHWDPPTIGRTARRLGVRTEASARFERGADPEALPRAQARAATLLTDLYGARVLRGMVDVYPRRIAPRVIHLRPERATAVLGVEIPRDEMSRILRALGCAVEGTRTLAVRAPTYRPDLAREEDLIEEIIRIYGYDRVPLTLPIGETTPGVIAPAISADRSVREVLTRCGLVEALTLTLIDREDASEGGASPVVLRNPLARDHAALRTSLLPGLIEVLATNAARRVGDVQVFELGRVFRSRGPGQRPEEERALGIAVMGRWRTGWNIAEADASADLYHLRWILDALFGGLGAPPWRVDAPSAPGVWWHPGRVAEIACAGHGVARFGELHPDLAERARLPHRAYLAEVDIGALYRILTGSPDRVGSTAVDQPAGTPPAGERTRPTPANPIVPVGTYRGLPRFPEVERDLAAVVPVDLPSAHVEDVIRETAGSLLSTIELFDVYAGPPVAAGHRNLAYRLRFRAPDRTLTAEEAEEIMARVRIALRTRAGAELRV
jgi:phenylalanyl-tRNA synthetase beta chain